MGLQMAAGGVVPKYMRFREAADAVGVGVPTIKRAILTGELKAFRPSPKTVLIRPEDLVAWCERASASTQ